MGIDASDNLYLADQRNSRILKIDPSGVQSDFASVSLPYWASVGMDGYVYASSNDKTIQKFDLAGNKIETYSTGTYTPWGVRVNTGGGIYFVCAGSTVNRILGYADTVDRTHVKITLFYDLVNGAADPSAFTLSGVASNPQVTSSVVSGSEIDLTVDSNIESTDTTVKVSYTKTGTNNLVQQGTSIDVDAFSNLSVTNHIVSVASVGTLSTINVDNGTVLSAVGLPATVSVNLSNSTPSTTSAAVVWDGGTPVYDGGTAGTYTFSGTLSDVSMKKAIDDLLKKASSAQTPAKNLIEIHVQDTTADSTEIGLNGAIVKQMDQNEFDILINAGDRTYKIPAQELAVDMVANRLGVDQENLKSIQFYIQLGRFTLEEQTEIAKK